MCVAVRAYQWKTRSSPSADKAERSHGSSTLSDRRHRPQDDWIAQLGAALEQADAPPALVTTPGTVTASRVWTLPAWPWALSGAGLCLALLALDPSVKDAPAPHPTSPPVPQVQGWSSSVSPTAEWPRDVPVTGYQGITAALPEVPVPAPELPQPDDAPEPATPEPVAAIRPDPPEPEVVPVVVPASDPPPPPDFSPPQPDWGLAPLDKLPPLFTAARDLPSPRAAAAASQDTPAHKARTKSAHRPERERTTTRRKPTVESEFVERPGWAHKLFGSRES